MGKKVIQRHEIADYLNIGTAETPTWVLMGCGFTTLNEDVGAKSESSKYVHESTASSIVVSYESKFPFSAHMIPDEEAVNALYAVGRNHLTGSDAEFELCRVELWDRKIEGKYAARKFVVSAEITNFGGESKQELSGNLNAVGDPIDGTFDTKTKAFTAAV